MCTGRIDLLHMLRAFAGGADGLLMVGCRLDECNYTTHGNYSALNKASLCRSIMRYSGLNPDRLRIEFMSSGDGVLFAETVRDFVARVKDLGPLGAGEGLDEGALREGALKGKLETVMALVPYLKIALKEKLATRPRTPADYATLYDDGEIAALLSQPPSYEIDGDKCRACMICLRRCPVGAIAGGKGQRHSIDPARCIRCGTCFEVCPSRFGAVSKAP
jgi:F420-non-reducing hydrogenase iron-sulfur subunit